MHKPPARRILLFGFLAGTLYWLQPAVGASADVVATIAALRSAGCGGRGQTSPALHRERLLDQAAASWSAGRSLAKSIEQSGYVAQTSTALHLNRPEGAQLQMLRSSQCAAVVEPSYTDIGIFRRGADAWLILAAAYVMPTRAEAPQLATQTLRLVNEARAHGVHCGAHAFGPAPPLTLSGALADVAFGHAADMAQHGYFEHEDRAGHTPADRVRAAGYKEKLVGENIAYGPTSATEVVRGWLDSPGHCENIMNPRFSEMGLAYAPGKVSRHGLYWVQLFAAPRA